MRNFNSNNTQPATEETNVTHNAILTKVSFALIAVSAIFFIIIFITPFLPLKLSMKATIIAITVVMAEITWWGGVALLTKYSTSKYKKYFKLRKKDK